jgi:hypothetical protein
MLNRQTPTLFSISGVVIRQDTEGRYFLNDLHKAAGAKTKDKPSKWLALDQVTALIEEANLTDGIPEVKTEKGRYGGTYVCIELVYTYAMWISPRFYVKVFRALDSVIKDEVEQANLQSSVLAQIRQLLADNQRMQDKKMPEWVAIAIDAYLSQRNLSVRRG